MVDVVFEKNQNLFAALDKVTEAPATVPEIAHTTDTATVVDEDALREIEAAADVAVAERAERKLQEQAEEEARREAAASTDAEVRAKLRAALAEAGWGLSADDLVEAERLVAWRDGEDWAWAWGHRDRAQGYIERLHGFMARAAGRVAGAEESDEVLARVADPEARTIVLQGCRYLSGLDGDRAVEENGIGWSKTTSWTGHWLAGHEALDEREAAVASCAPGAAVSVARLAGCRTFGSIDWLIGALTADRRRASSRPRRHPNGGPALCALGTFVRGRMIRSTAPDLTM